MKPAYQASAASAIFALVLSGCQGPMPIETAPVVQPLAPMPQPQVSAGDRWHYLDADGEPGVNTVDTVDGDIVTESSSNGCGWTTSTQQFAPAIEWSGCEPHANGTSTVSADGAIWPMQVGSTVSFDTKGRNVDGDTWFTTRACEVLAQTRVTVPAGAFDTYHVQCTDKWRTRDWYVAPAVGRAVLYMNTHHKRNTVQRHEMVRFERAES